MVLWTQASQYYQWAGNRLHSLRFVLCLQMSPQSLVWFRGNTQTKIYNPAFFTVNTRLATIKPPNNIWRFPKSIENHWKYFKASELCFFWLFSGPAVLYASLHKPSYGHLLREAVFILLQESVSEKQLQQAECLLFHSLILFEGCYGLDSEERTKH